jgi:hypothetical protein
MKGSLSAMSMNASIRAPQTLNSVPPAPQAGSIPVFSRGFQTSAGKQPSFKPFLQSLNRVLVMLRSSNSASTLRQRIYGGFAQSKSNSNQSVYHPFIASLGPLESKQPKNKLPQLALSSALRQRDAKCSGKPRLERGHSDESPNGKAAEVQGIYLIPNESS